jgi:enamine deaminase RidA (YjgF/YER057c/UK114 family)
VTPIGSDPLRINPTRWSSHYCYDQAQLRPAPAVVLTIAGQGSVDEDGELVHAGDLAAQLALTVVNIEQVLAGAGMDLRDVLRLTVYTVDVDGLLAVYPVLAERLAAAGATPPATLLGVARLPLPGMDVLIDVTAGR